MKLVHINKLFQKEEKPIGLPDDNLPIKPRSDYFFNQIVIWTVIVLAVVLIALVKNFV